MATTSSSQIVSLPAFNAPRPQLSQEQAEQLQEHQYRTLPRTGTSPLYTVQAFLETLDAATLQVADLRAQYDSEGRSDWWHMADLLDDLSDLRTALNGQFDGKALQRSAVCTVVQLPTTVVPDYYTKKRRSPRATPETQARNAARLHRREYKLQNLPLCAGPSIVTASMFYERMMGAVITVADLRENYLNTQRYDWWHMADLLDDLADLMDALRPGENGEPPRLEVRDLPYSQLWI